jgi:hypothetical protein
MSKYKVVYTSDIFEEIAPLLDAQKKSILKVYERLMEDSFFNDEEIRHRKYGFELALSSLGLKIEDNKEE